MDKTRVKKIMAALDCTEEEALAVIADDDAIDHGAKLFELSDAQKKASKKARQTGQAAKVARAPREKKVDNDKQVLMEALEAAITGAGAASVEATNPERQLDFEFNGRKFRIVLSAPRK